ncbi:MAG: LPXTG cell wall anchor domain-containing protein, partial [Coriobacteriia bacterium]|nr:LPXTG cell wall anchor domain-containing protein [Coriobacteriia bacterium]
WTFDETVWFVLVEVYEDGTYDVGYITIDDLDIFLADHEGEDEFFVGDLQNHVGAVFTNYFAADDTIPATGDATGTLVTVLSLMSVSGVAFALSLRTRKTR